MSLKSERKTSEDAKEENVAMINCRLKGSGGVEGQDDGDDESEGKVVFTEEMIREILGPEEDTQ